MPFTYEYPRPAVTVDMAIVSRIQGGCDILLIKRGRPPFEGCWALPGGFVEPDEPLETAARRELEEETAIRPLHLEQMHTFGEPGRDPRGWTISVVYVALLHCDELRALHPQAGSDAGEVAWFDLNRLPPLAFDHADILAVARDRLARTP